MQELNMNEVEQVNGGVSQELAIGGNLSIVAIGTAVGLAGAAATAPIWFTVGLISVSIALTGSYIASGGAGAGAGGGGAGGSKSIMSASTGQATRIKHK